MTDCSPGLCSSIQLIHDEKNKQDLGRCIICQNIKDMKGDSKLTSNPEGRKKIIDASHVLQDDILPNFTVSFFDPIQYHNNTRCSLLISYTNCAHSTMMTNTLCTMNFQNRLLMLMNIVSTKLSITLVSEEIFLKLELTSL